MQQQDSWNYILTILKWLVSAVTMSRDVQERQQCASVPAASTTKHSIYGFFYGSDKTSYD